jgi:hypothetical protein
VGNSEYIVRGALFGEALIARKCRFRLGEFVVEAAVLSISHFLILTDYFSVSNAKIPDPLLRMLVEIQQWPVVTRRLGALQRGKSAEVPVNFAVSREKKRQGLR